MNKKNVPQKRNPESDLDILREVHNNPNLSQRDLARNLDMSLGKLNYLIRSLASKGLIKINNFKNSDRKLNYIYQDTYHFLIWHMYCLAVLAVSIKK